MSDVDPDVPDGDEDDSPDEPNDIKQLRAAAKKGNKAEAEAATATRRAVFAEAGVPRTGKVAELFRNSYQGNLTEEDVQTAWSELQAEMGGLPRNETPDPTAELTAMNAARTGGAVIDPGDKPAPNPIDEGWEAWAASRKLGKPEAVASAEVSTRLVDAAVKGDERVLVRPWTAEELYQAQREIG